MSKECTQCQKEFQITDSDREFYKKFDVPDPALCPDCRLQLRWSWRNERTLYPRTCDLCKKAIASVFPAQTEYTVYCPDCWWGDGYDPLSYGRAYDPSRSFFEQFALLNKTTPKLSIFHAKSVNSSYTNYSAENKDCYMVIGALGCENCYYGYRVFYSRDVLDSYDVYKGELSYECLESKNIYNCDWSVNCHNSNNLTLCENCIGCSDCFGCINLRNKQYHIFNTEYTREAYEKELARVKSFALEENIKKYDELRKRVPHRAAEIVNCTDSNGNQLLNCKECHECFVFKNSENCSYCRFGDHNTDCRDVNNADNCELQLNATNLEKNYSVMCTALAWYTSEAAYCSMIFNSSNVFGCSGLKKQAYCILNKQYPKEEYLALRKHIVDQMKKEGLWGEFLPSNACIFAYNESLSHEYFPLTKEMALSRGWRWQDNLPVTVGKETKQWADIPADISGIDDSLCSEILACVETGRNYKIIKPELEFYRKKKLPLPRIHPDTRHAHRTARRNPFTLWHRQCVCEQAGHDHGRRCAVEFETTYAPERPEQVFCESCYQKGIV